MITIKNTQRKIKFNTRAYAQDAQRLLEILGYADCDLGILLTTNATIRKYNRDFRHKDKPTDILSFAYHADLAAGKRIKVQTDDDKNLGDLIISLEYVVKDAQRYNTTFELRMRVLLVHGVCHLLGYDHETDPDFKKMQKKEQFLLKKLE